MEKQDIEVQTMKEGAPLSDNKLLMVRILSGAVFIGTLVGEQEDGDVCLADPLLYTPVTSPTGQLQVHFDPVTVPGCNHPKEINETFSINPTNFMWVDTVSAQLSNAYDEAWKQIRAAESGIVLAKAGDIPKVR